uniref:NNMT/PNMT/TEMT family protein n=1 Tax=Parascaris univalens TaxID=6257 RepID=A0A914ZQA7_PARUN
MPEKEKRYEGGKNEEVISRDRLHTEFDTAAYLRDFYTRVDDPAMQLVLTFLPNIAARIGNVESLLDFGAGPTIHVAVAFRNTANNNREELLRWLNHTARFDWSTTIKKIATTEGLAWSNVQQMETDARAK